MKDANKDKLWLEHAKTSVIYLFIFEWDIPKNLRKSHAQQHNLSSHKITTAWAIAQSKSMRRVFAQEVRGHLNPQLLISVSRVTDFEMCSLVPSTVY